MCVRTRVVSVVAILASITSAAVAQTVEAPVYKSWSRVPVGTTMVQQTTSVGADGSRSESRTIQKLLSIDDTVAVVEQTYVDPNGESFPQVFRHRRNVVLLPGVRVEDLGTPPNATDKGEERLQLAGRDIETKWYDTTGQAEAGTMLVRTWYSDQVPGLIVKAVTRIEGYPATTTIELIELKLP